VAGKRVAIAAFSSRFFVRYRCAQREDRMQVKVSKSALIRRVNRKLAKDCESLHIWRTSGYQHGQSWQPGDIYRVDDRGNSMLNYNVDLEQYARECGALQTNEVLAEEVEV
jgi:hypothetical protein